MNTIQFGNLVKKYCNKNIDRLPAGMSCTSFYAHDTLAQIHKEICSREQALQNKIDIDQSSSNIKSCNRRAILQLQLDTLTELKEFVEILATNGNMSDITSPPFNWANEWEIRETNGDPKCDHYFEEIYLDSQSRQITCNKCGFIESLDNPCTRVLNGKLWYQAEPTK